MKHRCTIADKCAARSPWGPVSPESSESAWRTRARDWSRADLNGDGVTGGADKALFDLDPSTSPRGGAPVLSEVRRVIEADLLPFDEHGVTDADVLCYYAYSDLYSGSPDQRRVRLDPVNTCHASLPRTGTVTVTNRRASIGAGALHVDVRRGTPNAPGALVFGDHADANSSESISDDDGNVTVESGAGSATYTATVTIYPHSGIVIAHSVADVQATAIVTFSGPGVGGGSAGATGDGSLVVQVTVTGSVRYRITGTATDCGSMRLHVLLGGPSSIEFERGPYDLDLTGVLTDGNYEYAEACSAAAGIQDAIGTKTVSGHSDLTLTLTP